MLNFFKKKNVDKNEENAAQLTFKIGGMHCINCSMTIDNELEETAGVIKSETNYAKAKTVVTYDAKKVKPEELKKVIENLEYTVDNSK